MAYNNNQEPRFHVKGGKYLVVLPSALVGSFFVPTVKNIVSCLGDLKRNESLEGLKYVFLVGGFSSSPIVQAATRSELHGDGRVVLAALRPEVAIVRGAVLFANNAQTFTTRKARLTYGVRAFTNYDSTDPEHTRRQQPDNLHVRRQHLVGPGLIQVFSCHLKIGDGIPLDGACPRQCYGPVSMLQSAVHIEVLASRERDIRFPDENATFLVGNVEVPLDMEVSFVHRSVEVEFIFGGTEFSVNCFRQTTGEKIRTALLSLVQEVEEAG